MPGQTEHYGIRYPCPGDNINPADFANWTYDIENALNEVNAASQAAVLRPRAMLRTSRVGVAIPIGVPTQILFSDLVYNEGMDVGVGPTYGAFLPAPTAQPMLMMLAAQFTPLNTVTGVTSFEGTVFANNFPFARTLGSTGATTIGRPITVVGIGIVEFLFGALATFTWTGAGGPLNMYCQFSCSYIAPAFP